MVSCGARLTGDLPVRIGLPLDGWDVLRAIESDPERAGLPVIMLTSKTEDSDILRGHVEGAGIIGVGIRSVHAEGQLRGSGVAHEDGILDADDVPVGPDRAVESGHEAAARLRDHFFPQQIDRDRHAHLQHAFACLGMLGEDIQD